MRSGKDDALFYENARRLGNRIIIFSIEDYIRYHQKLRRELRHEQPNPQYIHTLQDKISQIDRFIDSPLYELYTELPATVVKGKLKQIREKYKECYDGRTVNS